MTARHASRLGALLVDDAFDGEVLLGEPMSRHTTYRIGGPARFFVVANSLGALSHLVEACEDANVPWTVVGRGSNLLVADEGFNGAIVMLGRDFRACRYDDERGVFSVGAGALLSTVVQEAFHRSLAGLEFAVGTPGTVGGAVRQNAGSRTEWLSGALSSVTLLTRADGLVRVPAGSIEWGYRSTSISPDDIVVECELSAAPADPFYVRGKMARHAAAVRAVVRERVQKPRGRVGRQAHRGRGSQGRARRRRARVGKARELHRERRRRDRFRRAGAYEADPDESVRGLWRRTRAGGPAPRIRIGASARTARLALAAGGGDSRSLRARRAVARLRSLPSAVCRAAPPMLSDGDRRRDRPPAP